MCVFSLRLICITFSLSLLTTGCQSDAVLLPKKHDSEVEAIGFAPDGKHFVTGGGSDLYYWTTDSEAAPRVIPIGHPIRDLAIDPAGEQLAVASDDKAIQIWDLKTFTCTGTLEGHPSAVTSVAYSPDGKYLCSTGRADELVILWDAKTMKKLRTIPWQKERSLAAVTFHPQSKLLAMAGGSRIMNLSHKGSSVTVGPNQPSNIVLWDIDTDKQQLALPGHSQPITCLTFNPSGTQLASGCESAEDGLKVWDVTTGTELATLQTESGQHTVADVAFTPDGQYLISAETWGLNLWDADKLGFIRCLSESEGQGEMFRSVAVSPDGASVVAGQYNGNLLKIPLK